ncbi:unnamed protein product, partial [Closterium sp. NIES-54]
MSPRFLLRRLLFADFQPFKLPSWSRSVNSSVRCRFNGFCLRRKRRERPFSFANLVDCRSSSLNRRKAAAKGDLAKLIWCFIGVVGTLIIYGIGQERIMKFPYGDRDEDSEYFQHSLFIVLCNRLMTCAVAVIVHLVTGASLALVAPIYAYGAVSLSNVISSGCQYEALKYVSFPLQTIAKSSRMVPVLIWGTLISRKQYKPREYIIAITIILGSCLFFLNVVSRLHARVSRARSPASCSCLDTWALTASPTRFRTSCLRAMTCPLPTRCSTSRSAPPSSACW